MEFRIGGDKKKIEYLPIDIIHPDPLQPRKHFDEDSLRELRDSIKAHNVLQPVLYRRDAKGKIILVSGERRMRAAKEAGMTSLPAIRVEGDPYEIALVENLMREDLTPIEEAEAMRRLKDRHAYTDEQLAESLGKGRSTITEILTLTRLPDLIKDDVRKNPKCPRRILVEIAKKRDVTEMLSLYSNYQSKGLTSDEIRKISRPKRERAELANNSIKRLRSKLLNINKKWKPEEKQAIQGELQKLKEAVEAMLSELSSI